VIEDVKKRLEAIPDDYDEDEEDDEEVDGDTNKL
jgi:hypothetical protein